MKCFIPLLFAILHLGFLSHDAFSQPVLSSDKRIVQADQYLQSAQHSVDNIESGAVFATPEQYSHSLCILVDALVNIGHLPQARSTLQKAYSKVVAVEPGFRESQLSEIRYSEVALLAAEGRYESAVKLSQQLLASSETPDIMLRSIRIRLIMILEQTKQYSTAEKYLDDWCSIPANFNDKLLLSSSYGIQMALQHWKQATQLALKCLTLSKNKLEEVAFRIQLSAAYDSDGKGREASDQLDLADNILNSLDSASTEVAFMKRVWLQTTFIKAHRERNLHLIETLYREKAFQDDAPSTWVFFVAEVDLDKYAEAISAGEQYLNLIDSGTQFQNIASQATAHYLLAFMHLRFGFPNKAKQELKKGLVWERQNYRQLTNSNIDDSIYFREAITRYDPVSLAACLEDPELISEALVTTQGFVYNTIQKKNAYAKSSSHGSDRLRSGESLLALFEFNNLKLKITSESKVQRLAGAIVFRKGVPPVFKSLGRVAPISELLNSFYDSLTIESDTAEEKMINALSELYRIIAKPLIEERLLSDAVLYFGDGVFASVPFHLLWHDGNFQIAERDIAFLPFISVIDRNGINYSSKPSIIVGDALYSEQDALPQASVECDIVASVWNSHGVDVGTFLLKEKANTKEFLKLKSPGYLHVVAHGLSAPISANDFPDPRRRLEEELNSSCLVLSKAKVGNGSWKGQRYNFVAGRDILDCDLTGTRCVMLHSCCSGIGTPTGREGNIGLITVLLSTGPHRAILTSWNIIDELAPGVAGSLYSSAVLQFDGNKDVHLFCEFQRAALKKMQEDQSAWKAVRSVGALNLYFGCR